MGTAVLFLADGFEEIEALTPVDLLRRAGIKVTTVSIGETPFLTGRSGITVKADIMFADYNTDTVDLIILPGGQPGTNNLSKHEGVARALKKADAEGRLISAICAAPTVLGGLGLLDGRKATCYPGCQDGLGKAEYVTEPVVRDGHIITSRGAGTAMAFAFSLIEAVKGSQYADAVRSSIVCE